MFALVINVCHQYRLKDVGRTNAQSRKIKNEFSMKHTWVKLNLGIKPFMRINSHSSAPVDCNYG